MTKFVLIKIEAIKGKQVFEKLSINGHCQFDDYEENINKMKTYESDLGKIYSYMQFVSDLVTLPKTKFRVLKNSKGNVKEYEFKSGDLRVYAIKKESGKIIILGGYKNNQDDDIKKFRCVVRDYLNEIQQIDNGKNKIIKK